MSQRNRIVLATAALLAALFLAVPSPSHAATQSWKLPLAGAWERAWSWLAQLLPGGAPQKPVAGQEKEGSAVLPDGKPVPGSTSPAPTGTQSEEGIGSNPGGSK
ncbi:MAG TPA: hypothetical protein VGM86_28200 [Thermoanaerobaculia bacterium]|jgi:hypothetical protein